MKVFKVIVLSAFAILVLLAVVDIWMFKAGGTDVMFQSSDKQWADSEVHFEGRNFKTVVVEFYLYRIKCNKPHVRLERLTKRPRWYTLKNLFNNYSDPKWQIPLGVGNKHTLSGYYPDVTAKNCNNQPVSTAEIDSAESQSKAFIANLKKHITINSSGRR